MVDPIIAARFVHFAATAICAGVIFFGLVIARPVLRDGADKGIDYYFAGLARLTAISLALVVLSGITWALLLATQVGDASLGQAIANGTLTTLLTETRFGQVWLGRTALAVILAATLLNLRRFAWLTLGAAMLLLISLAWVGHAGAREGPIGWLHVCADMMHLFAAGLWLGSLPALASLLANAVRGAIPSALAAGTTRRFSTFGIAAVAALLITGIINAWILIGQASALWSTDYGCWLLLKIGFFVVMLVLASINRWRWMPKMPAADALAAVRRNSLIEGALGVSVIIIVGILGTLPPPFHQHAHPSDAPPEAAFVHIHDLKAMADVTVLPGRAGRSEIWLRLMREDFSPLPAQTVTLRLTQSGQADVTVEARSGVVGLWRATNITLSSGIWSVALEIYPDQGPPIVLDAPIVIEP